MCLVGLDVGGWIPLVNGFRVTGYAPLVGNATGRKTFPSHPPANNPCHSSLVELHVAGTKTREETGVYKVQ